MFDTAFTFGIDRLINGSDPRLNALQAFSEAASASKNTILLDSICMSSGKDSFSSFAIREDLISPSFLKNSGLLAANAEGTFEQMLRTAYASFRPEVSFMVFAFQDWVRSASLYRAFRTRSGNLPWMQWPSELRDQPKTQDVDLRAYQDEILYGAFVQMQLFLEWKEIREAAYAKGLKIIGRLPYASAADSIDVWSHQDLFQLQSGVSSAAYDWSALQQEHYDWWLNRIGYIGRIYDGVILEGFAEIAAGGGHELMQALAVPAQETALYAVRNSSWQADTATLAAEAGISIV